METAVPPDPRNNASVLPASAGASPWILWLGVGIFLAAVGLFLAGLRPLPEREFKGTVLDLLPDDNKLDDWKVEYLPIADTPEMQAQVDEALNYDDAVFAVYRKGSTRLSVYIAYWKPGKMPYRLIAAHTPDVCWVVNGWTTRQAESRVVIRCTAGPVLLPAERRIMQIHGQNEHLVFWHVMEGETKSYGNYWRPPWYAVFTDLVSQKLNQRPEQMFVRISSNDLIQDLPPWLLEGRHHSLGKILESGIKFSNQ